MCVWFLYQMYRVIYKIHQNVSSPWIVVFQSNGLRPNAGQTNPVDLRDMLTSACPSSLSHFLFSISSLALIRGTVILHSSFRFKLTLSNAFHPSSSPSLTHIHKSLPFAFTHKCIFPLSHLYQTSQGLTPRWKHVCQGCFLPWAGTCLLQTIKRYCGWLFWLTHIHTHTHFTQTHMEMINDQIKIHAQSCIEAHQHNFSFPLGPPARYLCWCPVSWALNALNVISSDKDVLILLRGLLKSYWSLLSLSCY